MEPPAVPGHRIDRLLASGSSGSVWRGERLHDGLPVAVKVVPLGWGAAEDADQALREFAVLQRVRVEGLVGFHEVLALAEPVGTVALVLDLVAGGSLQSAVGARGHLSVGEAVTVVCPVARTLAGLHAAGVVHGDVSPANVLLERTGRPVLADLGVARLTGESPCDAFGTAGFTAPELETGGLPSPASDVYAVGALAWWCVAGTAPPPAVLRRPLADVVPGLPPAWVEVVERCLAARPHDRPSASEVALQMYDAESCEPLRLVAGEDEVSLLTRRIRSAAPTPSEEALPATAGPSRLRRGSDAVRATWCRARSAPTRPDGGRAGAASSRDGRGSARPTAAWLWPAAVGACAGTLVGAVVLVAGGAIADRGSQTEAVGSAASPSPVRRGAEPQPDPPGAASAPSAARRQAAAPRTDPVALMRELSVERARVMNSAHPGLLSALDVPGSPAWTADAELLEDVRRRGQRFVGVAFTVSAARTISSGATTATVAATVDTAPYTVEGPGDARARRPGEAGEEMRFDLRWSGGVWLVERVSAQST